MTKIEQLKAAYETWRLNECEWCVDCAPDTGDPVDCENALISFHNQAFDLMPQLLEAVELLKKLQHDRYSQLGDDAKFSVRHILEKLR